MLFLVNSGAIEGVEVPIATGKTRSLKTSFLFLFFFLLVIGWAWGLKSIWIPHVVLTEFWKKLEMRVDSVIRFTPMALV